MGTAEQKAEQRWRKTKDGADGLLLLILLLLLLWQPRPRFNMKTQSAPVDLGDLGFRATPPKPVPGCPSPHLTGHLLAGYFIGFKRPHCHPREPNR